MSRTRSSVWATAGLLALAGATGWGLSGPAWAAPEAMVAQAAEQQAETEPPEEERPTKVVKVFAENWKWTPKVIRVQQGTRLVLRFESVDAPHSFVLKGYGLKVPLPQDSKVEIEFIVDKAGTFRWRCGRPCGDGCPKMTGKLIVE